MYKTVTLAVEDLAAHPEACALFRTVLDRAKGQKETVHG